VHIRIGESISIPVTEVVKANESYPDSLTTAGHLQASALPGETGNSIIFGANRTTVFGLLSTMRVGDPVSVRTSDGLLHTYSITAVHTVEPTQTELLAPTTTEVLTIYTPTGLLDSQRLIIRAEPITYTTAQ
jgi:LPXTG-site transpeptidase (sortase) family protein